jgi:hypothetical protein
MREPPKPAKPSYFHELVSTGMELQADLLTFAEADFLRVKNKPEISGTGY